MKNLKRILSLALACVMLVGMMMVGASAAEIVDIDDVNGTNKLAVETMVDLGIISGTEKGEFQPEKGVSRAEMATMIAIALNGGNKDFLYAAGQVFDDVPADYWGGRGAKYIKYCADNGIISGYGNGKFGPDDPVTATQTAIMMLLAMGYRKEQFGGADWDAKVNKIAVPLGLYDDTGISDLAEAMTKEKAAQLIYNGIQKPTVTWSEIWTNNGYQYTMMVDEKTGKPNGKSILESKLGATSVEGILTAIDYDEDDGCTYTIDGKQYAIAADLTKSFQQNIKMLVRGGKVITATAMTEALATGTVSELAIAKGKTQTINGVAVADNKADDVKVYTYNKKDEGALGTYTVAADAKEINFTVGKTFNPWDEYELVDNDGDGAIDAIVIYPVYVEQIAVTAKTAEFRLAAMDKAAKIADHDVPADIADGAWVVARIDGVTKKVTATAIEKQEKVLYTKKTATGYTFGGTEYAAEDAVVAGIELGKTYDLITYAGHIFAAKGEKEAEAPIDMSDVVYVVDYAGKIEAAKDALGKPIDDTATLKVSVVDTKGEQGIIEIGAINGKALVAGETDENTLTKGALYVKTKETVGDKKLDNLTSIESKLGKGDGKLALTAAVVTKKKVESGKIDSVRVATDAIVFAKIDNKVTVKTGADLAKWKYTATDAAAYTAADKSTGFDYAKLAVVDFGTAKETALVLAEPGEVKYAYIVGQVSEEYLVDKEGTYAHVKYWDGEKNVDALVAAPAANASADAKAAYAAVLKLVPGDVVSFDASSTEVVTGLAKLADAAKAAVKAYGGNELEVLEAPTGKTYTITKDTVVIGIDDGAVPAGSTSTTIKLAADGKQNIIFVANDEDKIVVIFVEVDNKLYEAEAKA